MFHAQLLPFEELERVLRVCQLPLRLVELVLEELVVTCVRGGVIGGAQKGHTRGTGEEEFGGVVGELLGRLVLVGLGEVACEDVGGVGVIDRWVVGQSRPHHSRLVIGLVSKRGVGCCLERVVEAWLEVVGLHYGLLWG